MKLPNLLRRALVETGALSAPDVISVHALTRGRVSLVGRLQCDSPLRSPIKGVVCGCFYYRAMAIGSGRASSGARMRPLRTATVYASRLRLALSDGAVPLITPSSDAFDKEMHRQLVAHSYSGFRAREQVLAVGVLVRARGRLRAVNEGGESRLSLVVEALEPAVASADRDED